MIIKKSKGCLYAIIDKIDRKYLINIPEDLIKKQKERDNNKYHITIINSSEIDKFDFDEIEVDDEYVNLGLSRIQKNDNEVFFLFVFSSYLNEIRKKFSLDEKYFHITLGFKFNDIHDKEKTLNNIILKNKDINEELIYKIKDNNIKSFLKEYLFLPKMLIYELKKNFNESKENINILIENNIYLGYIFKYQISNDINDLKLAIEKYDYDIHIKYDPKSFGTFNCIKLVNKEIMKNNLEYRRKMYYFCENEKKIIEYEMPRNFSWIIQDKIGGISALRRKEDILVLQTLGIKKIYYFLEKRYFDEIDSKDIEIKYIHCLNTMSPKLEDMIEVLKNETFDEPILFGCLGGYGRTGTALACYLCKFGTDNTQMSSESSISYLRSIRPKSIESDVQMDFIKQFSKNLYKLENSNPEIKKIKTSIKFIMLVGLPGAGKTTFSDLFMSNDMNIKIINQDVMGRKISEQSLLKFIKESDITILDRVNDTKKDRKEWLENAKLNVKQCLCIYLSTPKFVCIDRVKNRENHPAFKKGGGERAINDIDKRFEIPTKDEGFSDIITLEDEEDIRNYLKTWNCKKIELETKEGNFIHKFPRTQHIFNIGGATVDDRILNKEDYEMYMKNEDVFIAEKVDGAQLGISIDENYKILIQNRSHYVNSKSHSQFEKLDKWIMDHSQSLYEILDQDTILFGEWLYAKHSISYDNLPDYFLAFDLYNKKKKLFYNRDILVEKLKDTSLNFVREMYRGKIKDKNQLLKMIEEKSNYTSDGRVEGIYLKIFEGDYVKSRCKLVRNDFLSGNDHWTKGGIQKNIIKK